MLGEQMILRALYGGAVEMDIPVRFEDVSDFRPVPDHQEVRIGWYLAESQVQYHLCTRCVSCRYGQTPP